MSFRKGDRVEYVSIDTPYFKTKDKGYVVEVSELGVLVELDKDIGLGCGWYIMPDNLRRLWIYQK